MNRVLYLLPLKDILPKIVVIMYLLRIKTYQMTKYHLLRHYIMTSILMSNMIKQT